jgi:hypothetical protein
VDLERLVKEKLNGRSKCSGHCEELSELKVIRKKGMMLGCYICPSGYVSLLVQYGKELDPHEFKTFLSSLQGNVTDEDIRVATRYNWDLGIRDGTDGIMLREAYWRQSYRRTKSDDPDRVALFLCANCSSFFHQKLSDKSRLCPHCRQLQDESFSI